ncbi:hypothetical protein F7725_021948 [Dissostichus mawsoni]|uniref:Uncharacterized protein n=1 Tax=Dissostichus mawsoni TaxID=36200 RepID=A0A7J5ZEV4_DISMA|nr:hypothetical protein F7725_021948 [Dissostichus mawsoni]
MSYMRDQAPTEEDSVVSEISNQVKSTSSVTEENAVASEEAGDDYVDYSSENKSMCLRDVTDEDNEVSEILHSEDNEVNERGRDREEQRKQNGGMHEEEAPKQHRKPERTQSNNKEVISQHNTIFSNLADTITD